MAAVTFEAITLLNEQLLVNVTYDSASGSITQVSWVNNGPAVQVLISMTGKADIAFTISTGSGSRNINKNQGYAASGASIRVST